MAKSTVATDTSNRSLNVEKILANHLPGGESAFRYVEAYPIADIERNPDSQSRLGTVDRSYVAKLAISMGAGTSFAPVVLWETDDNGCALVDGNHRTAAHIKRGIAATPAYLVKLSGANEALWLSAVFNGANGQRLTTEELRRAILAAGQIKPEPTNASLAQDYGVSASQVGRIRTEHATKQRLDQLSIPGSNMLTQGQIMPLAKITLDEPFRKAAALLIDAQVAPTEARALVKDITEAGSEQAQLARIAHARVERDEDIKAVTAGRKSAGSPVADLRRAVGMIEKLIEQFPNAEQWVSVNSIVSWSPRIEKVAEHLDAVRVEYYKAAKDMPQEIESNSNNQDQNTQASAA